MPSGKVEVALYRAPDTQDPIVYVGRIINAKGVAAGMMPHSHPGALEVCYVTNGHLDWWAGDATYHLRPQDILVTLPQEAHGAVDSAMQPCEYYWVHVAASAVPAKLLPQAGGPDIRGVHHARPEIGDLVRRVLAEHQRPDEHSASMCRSLVELLLVSLVRSAQAQSEPLTGDLVRQAQKALLEEEADNPSVGAIARKLKVSAVWLTRKFRLETGESPAQWVRGKKLAQAKEWLASDAVPIGEIAMRLGYSSSQYFATVFRREIGMTPTEFRELREAERDA
jgi:AraC family transcriptional regulator, L-rhamnose operon regulatory protein RhaS